MTLKLLSYNIRYGGAGREARLAAVVRAVEPDLVMLQEATDPAVVERVAGDAGMAAWGARRGCSTAFMSRVAVEHSAWHKPPGARHPFVEVVPAGSDARVFGLHLSAVHSAWTEARRARELRATVNAIEPHRGGFHALVGDFNALAPDVVLDASRLPLRLRPFVWLSGGYRQRAAIPLMLQGGYVDCFRLRNPDDAGFTFPTWDPHVRLDYLFVPLPHAARVVDCRVVRDVAGLGEASDHFPLFARIEPG